MAITFKRVIRISKKLVSILMIDSIRQADLMVNALLDVILSEMDENDKEKDKRSTSKRWKNKRTK